PEPSNGPSSWRGSDGAPPNGHQYGRHRSSSGGWPCRPHLHDPRRTAGRRGTGSAPNRSFGKNSAAKPAPNTNPPMWAQNATPPPFTSLPSSPTPLNSCNTNHSASTT